MCTVTYIPANDHSFILTSNRDESALRETSATPVINTLDDVRILMPVDKKAGGTWIAASEKGRIVCLLNGAFERHKHEPPYKKSRGIVVLDSFGYPEVEAFIEEYSFEDIEPFTMLLIEWRAAISFTELRWDGKRTFKSEIDRSKSGIWSSAPLYPKPVKEEKEHLFKEWIERTGAPTTDEVRRFHHSQEFDVTRMMATENPENKSKAVEMIRKHRVQTVSITTLKVDESVAHMEYEDLLNNSFAKMELNLGK
ncbi:MAG: NRDE family protein [Bacteroidetes bacterium]|nr:NRDE family protein [Bacteroidota bacterium]